MNYEATGYEKALKKQLLCSSITKKHLLQQFHSSLDTYLEDHPSPTKEDLHAAFGPPKDMAQVLMEGVSKEEKIRFEQQQKGKQITIAVVAALLLALTVYVFFWKEVPINSYSSVTESTSITTDQEVEE